MITYKWIFPAFECIPQQEPMNKIVKTIHWIYEGTTEDGITADIYGAQAVGTPTPDAFIPYPDLSEEQVIGWMEEKMNIQEMQERIAVQIEMILSPITVLLPPPFGNN